MQVPESLRAKLAALPQAKHYLLAFSGGLDSHVLLHALVGLSVNVRAVHVHHGLQLQAEQWAKHCEQVALQLGVPFELVRVTQSPEPGESVEAWARQMRYDALMASLQAGEMLLTAQHQDDQAETVLLQLLRGAGLAGLAGMPSCRAWGRGWMARPLLDVSRAQLVAYAQAHELQWVEDPSNLDARFDRNFLRHQVMPLLQSRWPAAAANLARSAAHIAAADRRLFAHDQDQMRDQVDSNVFDLRRLQNFDEDTQAHLLRSWLRSQQVGLPSQAVMQQVLQQQRAEGNGRMLVCWGNLALRRYRQHLHLGPASLPRPPQSPVLWRGDNVQLPQQSGFLSCQAAPIGIALHYLQAGRVQVRWHRSGDKYRLLGRAGSRSFKQLCQQWAIPVWLRPYVPLVCIDDTVISIAGLHWTQAFEQLASADACAPRWQAPTFR